MAESIAIALTTTPDPRSFARMMLRREKRSAIAPPSSRNTIVTTLKSAPHSPISSAPPPSARIWNGSATPWMKSPKIEIV